MSDNKQLVSDKPVQLTRRQLKERWHLARAAQIDAELRGQPDENGKRHYATPVVDIKILPLFNSYFTSPHRRPELSIYAKSTCKKCNGHGFVEHSHPQNGIKWSQVCSCASKRIASFQEEENPHSEETYAQWLARIKS